MNVHHAKDYQVQKVTWQLFKQNDIIGVKLYSVPTTFCLTLKIKMSVRGDENTAVLIVYIVISASFCS